MNNILEKASFGKPYLTRDGRKAIYWKYEPLERWHILIMENSLLTAVFSNGKMCSQIDCGRDIVSEYPEEIDEEDTSTNGPKLTPWQEDFFNGTHYTGDVLD